MNMRIATLGATLFTVATMGLSPVNAASTSFQELDKYFTLDSVELFDVTDGQENFVGNQSFSVPSDGPALPKAPSMETVPATDAGGIDIGTIISLGEKIWAIIEKNKPVVVQNYSAVSAVPQGVTNWQELDSWSEPSVRVFKVVYKNKFAQRVVEFTYRAAFTYGGTYNGKGKFLSRVEIDHSLLNVAWGYKFNAGGEVLNITNAGTKEDPMAAMELRLNWAVDTVMKHSDSSVRFYIRGDGYFRNLTDGNTPSELK